MARRDSGNFFRVSASASNTLEYRGGASNRAIAPGFQRESACTASACCTLSERQTKCGRRDNLGRAPSKFSRSPRLSTRIADDLILRRERRARRRTFTLKLAHDLIADIIVTDGPQYCAAPRDASRVTAALAVMPPLVTMNSSAPNLVGASGIVSGPENLVERKYAQQMTRGLRPSASSGAKSRSCRGRHGELYDFLKLNLLHWNDHQLCDPLLRPAEW